MRSTFFEKNPPAEISDYNAGYHSYLGRSTSILHATALLQRIKINDPEGIDDDPNNYGKFLQK